MRVRKAAVAAAVFLLASLGAAQRTTSATRPSGRTAHDPARSRHDPAFDSAAVVAWSQFTSLWIPETGLAKATPDYGRLTPWDIGSVLAAVYSARELGLVDGAGYRARARRTLETLRDIAIFDSAAFHKLYDARTARMIGKGGGFSSRGYAYSATDLGRLLIWLRIVAESDSTLVPLAERVARRVDFAHVVANGYLHGEELSPRRRSGVRRFQEGRIGYEQYSARGFALWGAQVDSATDLGANADTVTVDGVPLLRDRRGMDRLTSEPLILLGLELGWTRAESLLSVNLLRAQETRWRRTHVVTIASEDAVGIPPHYFYYYCVYCSGKPWVIETAIPGRPLGSPRWVSTKATFAWHALLPGDYTRVAMDYVGAAHTRSGWRSGVMERNGKATRSFDVNTVAVVLEAAAYHRLGRPLLAAASARPR